MIRISAAVCVVLVLIVPGLSAEETWVPFSNEKGRTALVDVTKGGAEEVVLELTVPGVALEAIAAEGRSFTALEVPGMGRIGEPGQPRLPVLRRFVEVPVGAEVSVQVQVLESERVNLADHGLAPELYPAQLPRPKCDCEEARNWRFSFKPEAYRGVVRHEPATVDGPFGMRDHRLFLLTVAPVAYHADSGVLEVARRTRVHLRFSGGDLRATRAAKERLSSRHFDAFLQRSTINLNLVPPQGEWSYPDDAPIEFLIITPPQFVTDLQPFVDWKTTCGYNVTVATTNDTGTTTTSIGAYIFGLYGGPDPPVYILMIGDSPTPLVTHVVSGGGAGGTDLPYVQIDTDLYPDMMIARWPVDDSTELVNMRDKILFYEQPTAANSPWLDRALFLAGSGYEGTVTTHEDVIDELMEPPPNSAECELWYHSDGPSTQDLISDLNTGRAWTVYSAHCGPTGMVGDPPFHSSDVPNMANTDLYPIGIGHCCQSNMWNDNADVFGEVAVTQPNKGFVSYWGGSNNSYWDEDDWLEKGFFDAMFDEDMSGNAITLDRQYSNVAACYSGLTEVTLQGGSEDYYWHLYNLDGDPTLDPFTRQPIAVTVGVDPVVPPTASSDFTVTVTDTAVGPVPVALVGVSQNGALLGAGFTDATGTAVFPIAAPTAGSDLLVRVTAHNHLPTDALVPVAAGSDGVVALSGALFRCDAQVDIDVFDDDLDGQGTIGVTVAAHPSGGSTTVQLAEQPGGFVQYHGTVNLGADLVVFDGDTLTVTYHDADTGGGGAQDKTDTALLDCAGPVISGVTLSATQAEVEVRFTTGEPGTAVVHYWASQPPGDFDTVTDDALSTDHSVVVSGLDPCRTYWFAVASEDALGNLTEDTNGGAYYSVQTDGWMVLMSEGLDADPGWTIENAGNANGWAFGQPTGGGGYYGQPDPTSGHTGSNVFGVNLNGIYDEYLSDNQLELITPSIDCSLATTVFLDYWRWLGVESSNYDHARVQVSVDGGGWTTVWENGSSSMAGGSWVQERLDLTARAAGHADLRIRWTLGTTDGSVEYCGWNIDDVVVEGAVSCSAMPMFADGFETGDCGGWGMAVGEQ